MLKRIEIANLKSIRDVRLELAPLTLLLGKSGSGKSNLAEAFHFLRSVISGLNDQTMIQQLWRKQSRNDNQIRMGVSVEFELDGDTYSYHVTTFNTGKIASEQLLLNENAVFERESQKWVVKPTAAASTPPPMAALAHLPSEPAAVYSFAALSSIGLYDFGDEVFRFPGQARKKKGLGFLDDGSNVIRELANLSRDIKLKTVRQAILSSVKVVNPTVTAIEVNSVVNPSAIVVTHGSGPNAYQLNLNEESAGFRRFLAILLALYQTESKMTVLFEHPEDGIHPGALSLLAEEFAAAHEEGRGQVILTSHSPQLLDHFGCIEDAIRVVEMDRTETKVGPLDSSQQQALRDRLLKPGDLLTTDDARMDLNGATNS